MIKFFRHIRKSLLEQNQMGKYFKYAIGEIILVVIGILIALQINNWNQNRLKEIAEVQFYKNTKQRLLGDASNLKGQLEYNKNDFDQFIYAIKLIEDNDRSKSDSLGLIAIDLLNYSDFDRHGNIYETTVNSGDIKLLNNNEIVNRLRTLEERYIYINRLESIHFNALMTMVPELNSVVRLSSKKVENIEKLYDYQFQNLFAISIRIMREKDAIYKSAINEIQRLVSLMDKEINND